MTKVAPIDQRKSDHIKINLEQDVRSALTTGLENYRFVHEALPELDLNHIDTTLSLFGKKLHSPILISSMTGGTDAAGDDQPATRGSRAGMRHRHGSRLTARRHRTSRTGSTFSSAHALRQIFYSSPTSAQCNSITATALTSAAAPWT